MKKQKKKLQKDLPSKRNIYAEIQKRRTGNHAGHHHTRNLDVRKGNSRKPKHKKAPEESEAF